MDELRALASLLAGLDLDALEQNLDRLREAPPVLPVMAHEVGRSDMHRDVVRAVARNGRCGSSPASAMPIRGGTNFRFRDRALNAYDVDIIPA